MRRTNGLAAGLLVAFGVLGGISGASAQPAQGAPGAGAPPANGADQVVGLFGATCLQFPGNPQGVRGWLKQQGAPAMPDQARAAFLAGRAGQVFDVSLPGVNLALVSLDDGGCEAVAEKANAAEVQTNLQQSATEAHATLTPLGAQADAGANGVRHTAYMLAINGRQMHVLVATAPSSPQAVIALAPK